MPIRDQRLRYCFSFCFHCLQSSLEQPQFIFAAVFPDLSVFRSSFDPWVFSWPPKGSGSREARIGERDVAGFIYSSKRLCCAHPL